jgi:transcriptional regulator with XRE-family HTH domain
MKEQSFGTLMTLTLILIMINILFFSTPAAGSDELKREILEDLLSLDTVNRPGLFGEYEELYLAKTKTQAVIQGMEGREVTSITGEWVETLLGIIDDFEKVADLSTSSVPSDHVEAIEIAEGINTSIAQLNRYETAQENGIPMLAALALERFYRGEGEFFEDVSRNERETRVKIEYEKISSSSYKKGGTYTISDASRMEFESRRDEWLYERDLQRAAESLNASMLHLARARNPSSGFFGAAFIEILKAKDSFEQAQGIYEKHEDKELENIKGLESEINAVYQRLIIETLTVVALYLLILSVFTIILWKDFERWDEELNDTRLGEELIG